MKLVNYDMDNLQQQTFLSCHPQHT